MAETENEQMLRCVALTGFLGSGKTTLLLALAQELTARGEQVAIVENERGAVGVDGPYLEANGLAVREINDKCVCCDLQSGLGPTVRLLRSLYHPSWLLLEASGVAHPDELANTIEDEEIPNSCWSLVALVDALRFERMWRDIGGLGYLLRWQIERADLLLLTRVDLASPEQVRAAAEIIRGVRPDVRLLQAVTNDPLTARSVVTALEEVLAC